MKKNKQKTKTDAEMQVENHQPEQKSLLAKLFGLKWRTRTDTTVVFAVETFWHGFGHFTKECMEADKTKTPACVCVCVTTVPPDVCNGHSLLKLKKLGLCLDFHAASVAPTLKPGLILRNDIFQNKQRPSGHTTES